MSALILASSSASRRALLARAGVAVESVRPMVDEAAAKQAFRSEGLAIQDQAMALAELKATRVSMRQPGLVIGGDQMLSLGGRAFDKPESRGGLRAHLEALLGQTHTLETAIVACEDGQPVWRHLARPRLSMRRLTPNFIDWYVETADDAVLSSVGGYHLEGLGAQLFARIEGDYFSILGLPLLPLLDYLRTRGILPT